MIVLAFVPLLIWALAPKWLQPILAWAGVVLVAAALLRWLLMMRRDQQAQLHDRSRGSWRWHRAWNAADYGRRLTLWLRLHGWRIAAARTLDAHRLLLTGGTERQLVVLLCVQPGHQAQAADLAQLEQDRSVLGHTALAVLVSDTPPQAGGAGGPMQIGFRELPGLSGRVS